MKGLVAWCLRCTSGFGSAPMTVNTGTPPGAGYVHLQCSIPAFVPGVGYSHVTTFDTP